MNKIRRIQNKIKIVTLCLLTIISGLIGTGVNIKGATSTLTEGRKIPNTGATVSQGYNSAWWADGIAYIYADGQVAFCIEPTVLGITGHSYSPSDFSGSQGDALSKIVYYGWDKSAKTDNDYAVTQYMIWEELGASISWMGSFGNIYPSLKSNVQSKINQHGIRPSFNTGDYEVNIGESITITDTNGVLGDFHVASNGGANVNISGNDLVITPYESTPDNTSITLEKVDANCQGSSIAYRSGSGQDVGLFKVSDPIFTRINVKVNKFGSVKITKTNDEGQYIPNTTFKISYNSDMSSPVGEYTTASDGTVQIDNLKPQLVYIQETNVPQNLVLNPTINSVMVVPNDIVSFSQTNTIQKGKLTVNKVDSETNGTAQGDATLEGAVYGLFTRENIVNPITNDVLIPANTKVADRTTKSDGTIDEINNLYLGKYYFKELTPSLGYNLDPTEYEVDFTYEQNIDIVQKNLTVKENVIKGKLKISKHDKDTNKVVKREGFEFAVFFHDGTLVDTVKTDETGYAITKDLPYGNYYFYEIKSGSHYVVDTTTKTEASIETHNSIVNKEFGDIRVNATLNVTKTDADTGETNAQGEATLEGAVYGLYARNDIVDPSNDGTVLFEKDKLVEKVTIKDAKATIKNLYLGDYYWKEISASQGYKLDTREYDISPTWEDENTVTVTKSTIVKEDIITGDFDINKVITDGESSGILQNEKGAEFLVVLKKYVDKYGSIEEAYAHKSEFTEKEYDKLITNDEGYDKTNPLAFGTYVVKQTKGQIDTNKYEAEWEFKVSKENQKTIRYIINNRPFSSYLKLVKLDEESGKTVVLDQATFKIFDVDNNTYLTQKVGDKVLREFSTNDKGYVVLPLQLKAGNYRLEEIKTPDKYLLNKETVDFKVTNGVVSEVDKEGDPIKVIEFSNKPVKGEIEIEKRGEVLTSVKTDKRGNTHFGYSEQGIEGMESNIVAAKDILDPADGSILYKKDQIVESVTTGKNGKASSSKLPLGEYYVIETKAPKGFTINTEKQYVSLQYKDDKTVLISKSTTIDNERQKVEIAVLKEDFDNENVLAGAKFGLYADEDIYANDGTLLISKGTLIETQISGDDGVVKFQSDIPLTHYSIKEIEAPIGYSTSDERITVNAEYQGQNINVIKLSKIFKNKITKVEISKTDITTGKELAGNHLTVFEKGNKGNIFDTWISSNESHIIKGLEVGKTYVLHEVSSSFGFSIAKDIEFTIEDTGEVQKVKMENKIAQGKLVFEKFGNIFMATDTGQTELGQLQTPVWEGSNLLGAEITLYADEDITLGNDITYFEKDEAIQTLTSDWEAVESQLLPVGKYYYVESKAPVGYVKNDEKHYFEIEDNQKDEIQVVKSTLKNERPSYELDFTKMLEENDIKNTEAYKDVVFGIYTRDDTYNYKGDVAIIPNTLVYTSGINEDGKLISTFELPVGNYYIKELATNEAYILDEKEYDFSINQSDEKNVLVKVNEGNPITNELKDYKILVNKVDSQTMKNVISKDFEFTRFADRECTKVIDKAVTNTSDGTAMFDDIHYGVTYIKETKAPLGYKLSDEIVKVEVNNDGVFVNDEKYSADDKDVYSIVYLNSLLPSSSVNTGDSSNVYVYLSLASVSTLGIVVMLLKRRKRKNDLK